MQRLMDSVLGLAGELSPDRVQAIAGQIECASGPADVSGLAATMPNRSSRSRVNDLATAWTAQSVSGAELAGMIRGASAALKKSRGEEKIELVWTGPDTRLVPVRRSEQVLQNLIDSAEEDVFIVSYVSFNLPSIDDAIGRAISRGVRVRMLLESEGRDASFGETVRRYKESFPGLETYIWPVGKREAVGRRFASVHAKCAVADGKKLFVTSANLTGAAMDKNIEMGIFVERGAVAKKAKDQLMALITIREIVLA